MTDVANPMRKAVSEVNDMTGKSRRFGFLLGLPVGALIGAGLVLAMF